MIMYNNSASKLKHIRKRLFTMVSVGVIDDTLNRGYDIISISALVVNLAGTIASTFNTISHRYGALLSFIEMITVLFFALDYLLRIFTATEEYPDKPAFRAVPAYIFSFTGIIDLLSFLPYYMPMFFPAGAAAFKMFRVARILRLFRINAYYDSMNAITEVIISKKQQLLSSIFIISVMILASSLCMYSLEHDAQPEVFSNAFSGIWWAVSTLLTVGYGDIYPVTPLGQFFGIIISFLGVGLVAIPTGIISAGFVEQYQRLKKLGDYASETELHFIKFHLEKGDKWIGMQIKELGLPTETIFAVLQRSGRTIIPHGNVVLRENDVIIMGAQALRGERHVEMKELVLKSQHPWVGERLRNLDISRQTFIVMIKRKQKTIIPNGDVVLRSGDTILMYDQSENNDDI